MTEIRNRQNPSQLPREREDQPAAAAVRRRGPQADADGQPGILPASVGRTAMGVATRAQVRASDSVTTVALGGSTLTTGGATGLAELRAPAAALDATTVAGARSFATQLHTVSGFSTFANVDSDGMTSAFLKLQATDLSTGQEMEGLLNQARSTLRLAAFKLESQLRNADAQAESLRSQAQSLESQAEQLIDPTTEGGEGSGADGSGMQTLGGTGATRSGQVGGFSGGSDYDSMYKDAWRKSIDAAASLIAEAANLRAQADRTTNPSEARRLREDAAALEDRAAGVFDAAGVTLTDAARAEMAQLARENQAAGRTANVFEQYLTRHPEVAQQYAPGVNLSQYAGTANPGAHYLDAIIDTQLDGVGGTVEGAAALQEATESLGAGTVGNADQELAARNPGAAQAFAMLAEAAELYERANGLVAAQQDALQGMQAGRTAEAQEGVMLRNQARQQEMLAQTIAVLAGTRPDLELRLEAQRNMAASSASVARHVLDAVDGAVASHGRRDIRS